MTLSSLARITLINYILYSRVQRVTIVNARHTASPKASTSNPRKTMSPLLRSSNLRSVPMNANSTGWRPTQAHSNTLTTGWSPSPPAFGEIAGKSAFCFFDLFLQPVAATNADTMHANGPAPGYPHHVLPVTARNPPAPNRNDRLAVINRFTFYSDSRQTDVTRLCYYKYGRD